MKKKIILSLVLITILSLMISFSLQTKIVKGEILDCPTTMYMPASKLEFYSLNNPEAIFISQSGNMVISEYNPIANENTLVIYHSSYKDYSEIKLSNEDHQIQGPVTYVALFEDGDDLFVIFLYSSRIHYLKVPEEDVENVTDDSTNSTYYIQNNDVALGVSFSVNGSTLIAQHTSGINLYDITTDGSSLFFEKGFRDLTKQDILYCFLSEDNDIYYFIKDIGIFCVKSDGVELQICETKELATYMTECGDYVYFTTNDALYRVKKEKNSQLEQVLFVTKEDSLGYLKSPRGLATKDGKLLVVDNELNCVQEIDPVIKDFTSFAITTESSASYRLTNNASNISLSEHYLYALDNESMDSSNERKRIVKISLDDMGMERTYSQIDLSVVYEKKDGLEVKYAASDNYVLIAYGTTLTLYEQKPSSTGKILLTATNFHKEDIDIASCYYLDNSFYYMTTQWKVGSTNKKNSYIYEIQLSTEDNIITEYTSNLIHTVDNNCTQFTMDIFGNIYVTIFDTEKQKYFVKKNNFDDVLIQDNPICIQVDFKGVVYLLYDDDLVITYSFDENVFVETRILHYEDVSTSKYICLTYNTPEAFILCDACILRTIDNSLNINTLGNINADRLDAKEILDNPSFIVITEYAKLFKVKLEAIEEINGHNYFIMNTIEPISSPNTKNVYVIIARLEGYYLISYSKSLTALIKVDSQGIYEVSSASDLYKYNIKVETKDETMYLTNDVTVMSKPIFDINSYNLVTLHENDRVNVMKVIELNGKSWSLVKDSSTGLIIGYVPTGYLSSIKLLGTNIEDNVNTILDEDSARRGKNCLLIVLIALTITIAVLLLENKILFRNIESEQITNG